MTGRIHSIETFGTVDGPGIRFVIFFQGCPLRCAYCHNPDSWEFNGGKEMKTEEIVKEVLKYKHYFKDDGGVTLTGGEPLAQIDFALELLKELKSNNIHTCVDTSGITFNEKTILKFDEIIKYVDLFLLDIKHINNLKHIDLVGKENYNILSFARYLSDKKKDVWIRHVLVPEITTNEKDLIDLKSFIDTLGNVKKIEILPYHKMALKKYEQLGIDYKLKHVKEPNDEQLETAKRILTS